MGVVARNARPSGGRRPWLDYHDPTAGVGGAPPAASALTLRLLLAGIALACCVAGIVLDVVLDGPAVLAIVLIIVALTTVVDGCVIVTRRHRGDPG
jgi:hypothetical protein